MDFDLQEWYDWLQPIFDEFIRTAQGLPNAEFWKSIVMKYVPFAFSVESRGCIPDFTELDGWITALFPNKYDGILRYNKAYKDQNMGSEMVRVGFKYERVYPNGEVETFPMELWAGIIGVHENKNTFGLEPKIGWFVRKSHEKDESLARLNGQNNHRGLELTVREVPEILKEIFSIKSLELKFTDGIVLPDWMERLKIEGDFRVFGKISRQAAKELKAKYKGIKINPKY